MTVKELRILVDNLDEYIHIPGGIERLKKTILHLAVSGQLVPQDSSDGTGQELYDQIQAEKQKLIDEGKLKKQKPLSTIDEIEFPFAIPKSWKWVRLGDIARSISYGYTESASKMEVGPRFVRITDIQNGQINWSKVPFCKINEKSKPKYLLEDGDILFARTGGTVGKSYLCKNPPESVFASYLIRVQPCKGFIPNFLLNYFDTPFYWALIYSDMSGTGQPNFNGTKLSHLLIPIPPSSEQERIVKKTEAIFVLIDKLAEEYRSEQAERKKLVVSSLAQLSYGNGELALDHLIEIIRTKADVAELRKTILHLAVSGQLVPQDSSDGTGQELYDQIQAEKQKLIDEGKLKKQKPLSTIDEIEFPFAIPKSWKWVRLGEILQFINGDRGKNYPSKDKLSLAGDVPFLSAINLEDNLISSDKLFYLTIDQFSALGGGKVKLNDLIVCIRGSLGKHAISNFASGAIASSLIILRNFSTFNELVGYYALYLDTGLFENEIKKFDNGTAQPNLSADNLKKFLLPLPPLPEQTRIVQKTNEILNLITDLQKFMEKNP